MKTFYLVCKFSLRLFNLQTKKNGPWHKNLQARLVSTKQSMF